MEKKLQKPHHTVYNSLTAQELWQVHYQTLFIVLLNEFIQLNVNMVIIIENMKRVGFNTKISSVSLNIQTLKMI